MYMKPGQRKIVLILILAIVGFTAFAKGFKCQDNYNNTIKEKEFGEIFKYRIGTITIQGQFNDDGTISYFVNDVYIVEDYNYRISGYSFYTSRDCFYFCKYGNTIGDSFYVEPIFDEEVGNPFDVNPFEE